MPLPNEESSTSDDDYISSTVADISESLFSKSSTADDGLGNGETVNEEVVEPVAKVEVKPEPVTPAPVDPAVVPGQNSVGRPLPKSWRKDMAPHWEKADPAIHEYVYNREAQVMRGLQEYQAGYQQWDNLIKPFAPIFQQNPDVQPVALMQGLMNTHLQFLNPSLPQAKKAEMLRGIAQEYGIDLGPAPAPGEIDPRFGSLEQRILAAEQRASKAEQLAQQQAQNAYNAGVAEQAKVVEAFAKDPKNEYFTEVGNDIFRFIQTGAATDLQSAYELACYANPAVRAKIQAKQLVVTPPPVPPRGEKGRFVNLEGGEAPLPRTRKGSIDSTIDSIVNSHYSGKH